MKQFSGLLIFTLAVLLFLSACGGSPAANVDVPVDAVESASESASEQPAEPVAESPPEQPTESLSSLFSFITDAYMARYVDGDFVRNNVFSNDEIVHAIVKFDKNHEDIVIKSAWFAVNVEGREPGFLVEKPIEVPGGKSGQIDFDLSNQYGWPLGDYSVEIYVNDYRVTTMEFSVQ